MENIAILGLRDKLTEIDKGINECANKNGSSMKSLLHIKDELNKAITILKACEGEMTKEGYGQLIIPDVSVSVCLAKIKKEQCSRYKSLGCEGCINHKKQTEL